jgi:hypothetical protein
MDEKSWGPSGLKGIDGVAGSSGNMKSKPVD